ncbi:MAG: hypothetical protein K2L45_01990 [Muribaculaceae bacterium]|nr:hypothetical protein [Muribaculaceae bacterium]
MKKFLLFAAAALVASSASAKWVSIIEGGKAADGETATLQAGWSGPAKVVDNPKGEGKVFECPIAENEPNGDGNFDDWKSQMFICFAEPVQEGDVIKVTFDNYCTDTRTVGMQAQGDRGSYQGNFQGFETKSDWQTYSQEITVTSQFAGAGGFKNIAICLSSKAEAATFYVNNVVVEKQVADDVTPVEPEKQVIAENDFATAEGYYFWKSDVTNAELKDGGLTITNDVATANFWDVQYMVIDGVQLTAGTEYYVDVKIKGFSGTLHYNFGTWSSNVNGGVEVEKADDWQTVTFKAVPEADTDNTAHLLLQSGDFVGSYTIANVKLYTLDESAVETIAPVKANTAVYNLQGVKVANSLEEVAAPGLYISNGKKIIKK